MRFYHVDPSEWTLPRYFGALERIGDLAEAESGNVSHRDRVERMARRRERGG